MRMTTGEVGLKTMDNRVAISVTERLCMWSGVAMLVTFFTGFVMGGFVPPPNPSFSAAEIAAFYAENADMKRIGIILLSVGGLLMFPFGLVIAAEMRRMLNRPSVVVYMQIAGITFFGAGTVIYAFMLLTITFRADRPDDLVLLLSDIAWLAYNGIWHPGTLMALAVAGAVFNDRHAGRPGHWPRWLGWLSLWYAFTSAVAIFLLFFKTGPFSWRGLFPFWMGAASFFGWWACVFVVMLRTTRSASAEELARESAEVSSGSVDETAPTPVRDELVR
jgi:hypothetical protein